MKRTRSLLNGLVACGVALAMVSTLAAQSAMEGAAKVVRIKGSARYTTGKGAWQPLKVGAVLRPGAVIQTSTDKGSYVDLVLGDGEGVMPRPVAYNPSAPSSSASVTYLPRSEQNTVRVMENTVLGIDKLSTLQTGADVVTDTQLDLKAGRIMGNVKKMSAASKYEIKLPNGVAGIRGTFYDITADGIVRVITGSVVVATVSADGTVVTQVVNAGQQYDARTGQISPISQAVMKEIEPVIPTGPAQAAMPTSYKVGPEVHYVSPVRGKPWWVPGPPPVVPPPRP